MRLLRWLATVVVRVFVIAAHRYSVITHSCLFSAKSTYGAKDPISWENSRTVSFLLSYACAFTASCHHCEIDGARKSSCWFGVEHDDRAWCQCVVDAHDDDGWCEGNTTAPGRITANAMRDWARSSRVGRGWLIAVALRAGTSPSPCRRRS
jgi:hypothetical protein